MFSFPCLFCSSSSSFTESAASSSSASCSSLCLIISFNTSTTSRKTDISTSRVLSSLKVSTQQLLFSCLTETDFKNIRLTAPSSLYLSLYRYRSVSKNPVLPDRNTDVSISATTSSGFTPLAYLSIACMICLSFRSFAS